MPRKIHWKISLSVRQGAPGLEALPLLHVQEPEAAPKLSVWKSETESLQPIVDYYSSIEMHDTTVCNISTLT